MALSLRACLSQSGPRGARTSDEKVDVRINLQPADFGDGPAEHACAERFVIVKVFRVSQLHAQIAL